MDIPNWAFYAVMLLFILLLIRQLGKVLKDDSNPIEWWQFISSPGKDGHHYADITKLGQAIGILLTASVIIIFSARVKEMDWVGFCALLTLVLSYLAGVQAFQAYLKSRQPPQEAAPSTDKQP